MTATASKIVIPLNALLAVYGIVPLSLLVIGVDQLFLGGQIREMLPRTPSGLFLYALLFVLPHIIASFFSLAEKEYLVFYRKRLLYEMPLLLLVLLLVYVYASYWAFMLYVVYTEYHQLSQQFGIGRFYFKTRIPEYIAWRILIVALASIGYGLVYTGSLFTEDFGKEVMIPVASVLLIPFVILSVRIYGRLTLKAGKIYFGALMGGVFGALVMLFTGYPALAVFSTRVEHDVPAFMAYIMHDYNRQKDNGENRLYKLFSFTRIPILLLSPLLAVGIGFVVVRLPVFAGACVFLLGMAHYYLEGFIWKSGSAHRRYIHFV